MPPDIVSNAPARRAFLKKSLGGLAALSFPRLSQATGKVTPVIMIDPGHGGHDSGATGKAGSLEKDLTLEVAFKLRDALQKNAGYKVVMTREDDVFVSLLDRVRSAQTNRAHLLISLHADALADSSIRGASVYRLSPDSSDPLTAELVSNHNAAVSAGLPGKAEYPPGVSVILESLMFREKQMFSSEIQRAMIEALQPRIRLLKNPARQGHFLVLRSGSIPSLLLEMGFLSNEADERLLISDDYQRAVVVSACEAIDRCVHRFSAAASSE